MSAIAWSPATRTRVANIMANWRHEVVARQDRKLPLGAHTSEDFDCALRLLEALVALESPPEALDTMGRDPFDALHTQLLNNTARVLETPIGAQDSC